MDDSLNEEHDYVMAIWRWDKITDRCRFLLVWDINVTDFGSKGIFIDVPWWIVIVVLRSHRLIFVFAERKQVNGKRKYHIDYRNIIIYNCDKIL